MWFIQLITCAMFDSTASEYISLTGCSMNPTVTCKIELDQGGVKG